MMDPMWFGQMVGGYGVPAGFGAWMPVLLLVALWSLLWKGLALWHSGRRNKPWWFVAFLLINTMGVLELIYLLGIAKIKPRDLFSDKR